VRGHNAIYVFALPEKRWGGLPAALIDDRHPEGASPAKRGEPRRMNGHWLAAAHGPSSTDLGFTRDRHIECACRPGPTCGGRAARGHLRV